MTGFFRSYKDRIEKGTEVPPPGIWDEISLRLDEDEVWQRVSRRLDRDQRLRLFGKWAAGAVVVLSALLVLRLSMHRNNDRQIPAGTKEPILTDHVPVAEKSSPHYRVQAGVSGGRRAVAESHPQEADTRKNTGTNTRDTKQADIKIKAPIRNDPAGREASGKESIPGRSPAAETQVLPPGSRPVYRHNELAMQGSVPPGETTQKAVPPAKDHRSPPLRYVADAANGMILPAEDIPPSGDLVQGQQEGPRTVSARLPGRFRLGLAASVKNTWLFNNETIYGMKPDELTTTIPHYGLDLGVLLAYRAAPRWMIQGEFYPAAHHGQTYSKYINGHYVRKEISMRYFQADLTGKYTLRVFESAHGYSYANLLTGAYAGWLYRADEIIAGEEILLIREYKPFNYGLILGAEFEYAVAGNLFVSPSFRVNAGLPNVYAGDGQIPPSLNKTIITSFKFSVSVSYRF